MWENYRKRFWMTQALILVLCAVAYFVLNSTWTLILTSAIMMELAALWGAWWAARLRRQFPPDQRE